MYLTTAQLAERPGALELAQVASDAHGAVVDAQLMEATLTGGDRSSYTPDEIAAADEALARIDDAITEASGVIDGYLGQRYKLPLPNAPDVLVAWARSIVRYKLHGDRISDERADPIARDYRDAIKFLSEVAAGRFSLGVADPDKVPESDVRIESGKKVFGREVLP